MNKALIFDMGGVLVDLDVQACKDAFKTGLGFMGIDSIIDACHQKGIYGELEGGLLSADDFRQAVLSESRPGAVASDVDKAMWKMLSGIEPYKAEMLRSLSADYDLYLLSNNNSICLERSAAMFAEAGIPLDKIFKECFFSFEMKMLKPSAGFYREVMNRIGLPASDMLFIDDSMANVNGALDAGLPAVYYEPGTDLCGLVRSWTAKMEGNC